MSLRAIGGDCLWKAASFVRESLTRPLMCAGLVVVSHHLFSLTQPLRPSHRCSGAAARVGQMFGQKRAFASPARLRCECPALPADMRFPPGPPFAPSVPTRSPPCQCIFPLFLNSRRARLQGRTGRGQVSLAPKQALKLCPPNCWAPEKGE